MLKARCLLYNKTIKIKGGIHKMNLEKKKNSVQFHIVAIVCILLFCVALTPVTLQNDTFYTIKIGEHIITKGIDMKDPFSWHEDLPYTYPHWAYDTGIYLIYQLGETTGLPDGGMLFIYLSTVILTCILGICLYVTLGKISKNSLLSFLLTMLVMYLLKDFIAARAQLLTFILFVLTILCIEQFLESKKIRYLIGIVVISLVIANVHVAVWPFFFVLFMPYIAEYIIAILLEANLISKLILVSRRQTIKRIEKKLVKTTEEIRRQKLIKQLEKAKQTLIEQEKKEEQIIENTKKRRENPFRIKIRKEKATKWLILVLVICALTGLLTPIQDAPYTYLVKTMQGNTTKSISEHQPLTLYNDKETMIVLALVLAILIFTDVKVNLRDFFMIAGLIFLSFMSRRQVSLLLLIGVFIFAKWIAYLIPKYDEVGSQTLMKLMTTLLGKILTISIVLLLCLVVVKPKLNAKFIDTRKYPIQAATWMLEHLDVANIQLYNEYNYGSYLLYRGIPVFIDSRADLYAPEFNKQEEEGRDIFSDYINISSIGTYYETKFEKYGITHVIVVNNAKLNMFLTRDEHYKQLYKDDNFTIYERNVEK